MIDKTLKQPDILTARQKIYIAMADGYQPGAIISHSWGWDQTNVDFYRIYKRIGEWVTLIPIRSKVTETGFMSGTCTPVNEPKATGKQVHKKLKFGTGKPTGFSNWGAHLWDAKPVRCSWDT